MECNYKELTYEEALEFYNRWGRTILVGSSPTDFYKTNKIRDKRSLDDCIKQYLNYYNGPVRFFLDPRTIDNDMQSYNKNESKNMNKKLIRLTESDLHRIVKESVNKIIKEWGEGIPDPSDDVGRRGYDPSAKDNEHEQYEDELGWEEAYYRNKYGD